MYYIAIYIIVILCGGYVSGDCDRAFYTNPSVNAPVDFNLPQDCKQWKDLGINKSDIYPVKPDDGGESFQVYCDMVTDGGGWTVIQRRMDGSVDFYRDWFGYENGFGNLNFEFWLGLSKIYRLTRERPATELQIKLIDFEGNTEYATYSTFNIGDSSTEYTLTIAGYSGTANDSMSNNNNMKFSTRDNDNDQYGGNCATVAEGAWWYNQCSTDANLNGVYQDSAVIGDNSVSWYPLKNNKESLQFVEMKIRPTQQQEPTPPPIIIRKDCLELKENGVSASGAYTINPDGGEPFEVYCDMETGDGGWTVFQRREDGTVDFYLNWAEYEAGFGNIDHEFWLGLSKIHRLTEAGVSNTLRVDLGDSQGNTAYAKYSTFNIGDSSTEYTLTIAGYSGTAGDDMVTLHDLNGWKFSTKDNDNDARSDNCAIDRQGAWWYNACTWSNLNGLYGANNGQASALAWYHWKNAWEPLKFSEMKIHRN